MASLTKTYTRDLSTAIAGKLWEAIKDADERRELEKSKASEEVKKAAVKLKKDDSNSIPVQDKDLRETVVRIFGPLEGKLLQTEGKVNTLSGKITSVAGGIADTQKLIINQNQILEDKFDMMLSIVGERSAIKKQKEAEDKFQQLEMNLEGALDLSKTFGYEKAGGRGGFNLLGAILSNVIGRKLTRRLTRNLYKSIVPRGLQARARLLSRSVRPFRRIIAGGSGGLRSVRNSFIAPIIKTLTQRIAKRFFTPDKLTRLGRFGVRGALNEGIAGRIRGRIATSKLGGKGGISLASLAFRARLFQKTGQWNVDKVVDMLLKYADADKAANRVMTQAAAQTGGRQISKKMTKKMTTSGLTAGGRKVTKEAVEGAARKGGVKKVLKKSSGKVANELTEDFLSKGIISAFRNPLVQKRIINKLGKEGAEKVFGKLALGGFKSVGVGPGTLYAFGEGLMRLSPFMGGSDPMGMLLSFGSAIPWGGWGVAILDILRDIDRFAFDQHILPTVMRGGPTNAEINNYFKDALDLDNAAQFERGNMKPTGGMGSSASAISEILGVTKAFGDATGFSGEVQGQIDAANLGSYPIPRANYTFDVGGRSAMKGFDKQAQADERKELSLIRKRPEFPDDEDDDEEEQKIQDSRWLTDPRRHFDFGNKPGKGGIGGDDNVKARTPIMGGDGATIEFWGQQGRDLSGEPGVDFSYKDYKSNYNLFPGYVLETGLLYGDRYGNVVVVRSVDPSNGLEFDSLYSHFPDGGIAVKPGQVVSAGEYLGKVGFVSVDVPGVPQMQPNNAGNMSGWHTSVDFFEPGSAARYRNLSAIQSLVTGANGQSPVGLLEKLKPPVKNEEQSSLNNIEANSKLGSAMTGLVENGSMDRKLTQKKIASRLPIVIVNNQVIRSNSNPIVMNKSNNVDGDFFEAYNLAKFSV